MCSVLLMLYFYCISILFVKPANVFGDILRFWLAPPKVTRKEPLGFPVRDFMQVGCHSCHRPRHLRAEFEIVTAFSVVHSDSV